MVGYLSATAVMYFGVGTSFLPSSTRAEANEVWTYFFSAWAFGLLMLGITRLLIGKTPTDFNSPRPQRVQWTDLVIGAQALVCVGYLLWGLASRLEGR
jgi:hypothetical protein